MKSITNTDRIEHNTKSQKNIGYNNNTKVISDLSKQSVDLPNKKKEFIGVRQIQLPNYLFETIKKFILSKTHLMNLQIYPKKINN